MSRKDPEPEESQEDHEDREEQEAELSWSMRKEEEAE